MAIKRIIASSSNIFRNCKLQKKMVVYDECLRCELECQNKEGKYLPEMQQTPIPKKEK